MNDSPLALAVVSLLRGVAYRDEDEGAWRSLIALQGRVHDHVAVLGLELVIDEAEGYAYLRQRPDRGDSATGTATLPRLIPRRPLSYPVSLLLALLRKRLAESDAKSGDTRLIVSNDDIVNMMQVFLADSTNEARNADRVDATIKKVVDLGFLRPLQGHPDQYEVRRILKAFVDAEWLNSFNDRLAEYRAHAAAAN